MLELLVSIQTNIRSGLSGGIDAFAATHDLSALAGMLPLALVFGMAHALTPGHGKSLLAAYAVGSDLSRLRVVVTAMALTVTHIGTAVVLALVANTLVTRTIVGAGQAPTPIQRLAVGYPAGASAYFRYLDAWRTSGDFTGLQFR